MPLDPQAQSVLDRIAAAGIQPFHALPLPEARRAFVAQSTAPGEPIPVGCVEDRRIAGPAGPLPLRLYTPAGTGPFPLLVYFHGGGWVLGNLDSHDALCRSLANTGHCAVMPVDYRMGPECPFPAAADDAYAATRWAATNALSLGVDASRIAVGGDSAGGNLAAVVALMARQRGEPPLVYQLLIYPITDHSFDTPSYEERGEGYSLSKADMVWYWGNYLRSESDGLSPYASPLRAEDLSGLPPALVLTAEYDPLRDEGRAYASRLAAAGVPVTALHYDGMMHGFIRTFWAYDQGKLAVERIGKELRHAFAR